MTTFKIHTPESAPEKSRPILKEVQSKMGFVPNMVGELAESPAALKAWVDMRQTAEGGALSLPERRLVRMTVSYLNDSPYCIAAGTTFGEKDGIPRDVLESLRNDKPLKDAKHEQLRQFTRSVMKRMGRPDKQEIDAFIKAGYTPAHILEVMMNISLAQMGNYVSFIAQPPLDKAFEPNRVEVRKPDNRKSSAA